MTRLRSCEGCERHVFVTERVCPFCKRELSPPPAAPAVPFASGASRAQRLALAAALAGPGLTAAAGCSKTTTPGDGVIVAGATAEGGSGGTRAQAGARAEAGTRVPTAGQIAVPVYGVPVAGSPAFPIAGTVAVPPYGVPVAGTPATPVDAGVDPDEDGGPIAVPVYGSPMPQD